MFNISSDDNEVSSWRVTRTRKRLHPSMDSLNKRTGCTLDSLNLSGNSKRKWGGQFQVIIIIFFFLFFTSILSIYIFPFWLSP